MAGAFSDAEGFGLVEEEGVLAGAAVDGGVAWGRLKRETLRTLSDLAGR